MYPPFQAKEENLNNLLFYLIMLSNIYLFKLLLIIGQHIYFLFIGFYKKENMEINLVFCSNMTGIIKLNYKNENVFNKNYIIPFSIIVNNTHLFI